MNLLVPVSWLREYLKTEVTAKSIANYLTLSGPSVERIEKIKNEIIFDIEVTTNRADSYSIYGLARETNAILKSQGEKSALVDPPGLNLNLEPDSKDRLELKVLIKDGKLCPRFTAIILDNVKIASSPAFIKNALTLSRIRPINNIVDITNYIMLELGQPMHAFDYDKVLGSKMILRTSKKGEKIKTLDDQTRILPESTIVIEDEKRLIDLCGIMGGANSQISRRSKRIILFVQEYNPVFIRKTTQALAFRTDAATRFEKGIDTEGILKAISRAVYLAKKTSGAKIASELIDIRKEKVPVKSINLSLARLNDYLGINLESKKAEKILSSLGFSTKTTQTTIAAIPPSWRNQDMDTQEDLIEEIARIYGYHNLPTKLPEGQISKSGKSNLQKVIELKKALKHFGLTEIISYSIISKNLLNLSGTRNDQIVELSNPLTEEWQYMRPTILTSHAQVISQNQNLKQGIKLFEIAKTYLSSKASASRDIKKGETLPKQDLMLSITLQNADFYEIKGIVENVFEILKRKPVFISPKSANPLFKDSLSSQIKVDEKIVGALGILNGTIINHLQIDGDVAAAEINLTAIYNLPAIPINYKLIPKFPPIIEDISAIFGKKMPIGEIIETVKNTGAPLVKEVEIIDIFEDEKLGENKKSVTLRLSFQKSSKTLSQEEVTPVRENVIKKLETSLYAKIRK